VGIKKGSIMKNWKDNEKSSDTIFDNISRIKAVMSDKIKSNLICENIAPIEDLKREIQSSTLKFGVFANNGSGKTFISRLFGLTGCKTELKIDENGVSPTDRLISLGRNKAKFSFSVIDKEGATKESFQINLERGKLPSIPKTNYIYHTFNQDYVEDNIRALGYEKDSEIEGFILGKVNIDLKEHENRLKTIEKEGKLLTEKLKEEIIDYLEKNINGIPNIRRLGEYRDLTYEKLAEEVGKEPLPIEKSFKEILENYNKLKSVPENLKDISKVETLNIDFEILKKIKNECEEIFSLSSLADDFKNSIKSKQSFIEAGLALIEKNTNCPFCNQNLNEKEFSVMQPFFCNLVPQR
jgi:hypothetical protein